MVTSQISLLGIGDYVVLHTDLLKGRGEDLKQDPYLRKSPSLESLSRPPSLGFGNTRLLSTSTGGLKPQSKLRYHVYTVRPHWAGGLVIFLLFSPPVVSLLVCVFFLNENNQTQNVPSAWEAGPGQQDRAK